MATGIIRKGIQAQRTILIRPTAKHWWEVMMGGAEKSHQFIDRRLAINYGKMWAAANAPSTVRVLGSSGSVDREWTYS
jgi:Uncharacterized protein conserved in bacteria (DUF2188)